jgi:hypothetical protein
MERERKKKEEDIPACLLSNQNHMKTLSNQSLPSSDAVLQYDGLDEISVWSCMDKMSNGTEELYHILVSHVSGGWSSSYILCYNADKKMPPA